MLLRVSAGLMAAAAVCAAAFTAACSSTTTSGTTFDTDASTAEGGGDGGAPGNDSGGGGDASDGAVAACDPKQADCVACRGKSCRGPEVCCAEDGGASCGSCTEPTKRTACDGPEDCSGGTKCCVQMRASATSTTASSQCTTCSPSAGSITNGSSVTSYACRTKADCAGVRGNFGVPYPDCCIPKDYDVGVCLSQTFSGVFAQDYGATCN
jgi:hypothetical protein